MSMIQLLYVSYADKEMPEEELDRILETCVRRNSPNSLTGMLLYSHGTFMQVLEGEEAAVTETYDRICQDPRHHNIQLLAKSPLEQRNFPNWAMGFRRLNPSDSATNVHYAPFFSEGFDTSKIGAQDTVALDILKYFAENE